MAKSHPNKTDTRKRELRFIVRKSVLYHDYRRKFYRTAQSLVHFIGLVAGSAAIANIGGPKWDHWVPAVFVVSSAIALVFRFSDKASDHSDLYKRFIRLERKFVKTSDWTPETLSAFESEKLEIEADEPSIYSALNRTCHNEVLRSEGLYKELQPLGLRHRAFKHVWNFHQLPVKCR